MENGTSPRVTAPVRAPFPSDHVDVWRVRLLPHRSQAGAESVLSPDEIARAERFRFARDRQRFVECRSIVRRILGRYLEIPAQEIGFRYEASGKPEITENQNPQRLRFNISHSLDLAVIAVVAGLAIGVDIEKIRPEVECLELAQRFFSEKEYQTLLRLPATDKQRAFFACWTRKEAFIKARGEGLSLPLSGFSVSVIPDAKAELQEVESDPSTISRWALMNLEPGEGYIGALAVEGSARRIHFCRFDHTDTRPAKNFHR
jgi:4'-phosphopantetheinyl transferase